MKKRLDELLVQKHLAPSREKAKGLILAGQVFSGEVRLDKAGKLLPEDTVLEVREGMRYVSRGGVKLEGALDQFKIDVTGKTCLDIGASTGGFTDCLLQRGAKKVYAVDVGYGQFHYKMREDPRIVLFERSNFRYFRVELIEEPIELVVIDVSFISLTKILPKAKTLLAVDGEIISLVKPQFELSPKDLKKGVVRSKELREKAVRKIEEEACRLDFKVVDKIRSPILGPKGNEEFFLRLSQNRLDLL